MIIDAHQHFWQFDAVRDSWITEDMEVIKHDFMPDDLSPILKQFHIDGTIAIQADQSEKENEFLLQLSNQYSFIKGIIGWIDLQNDNIEERLSYYSHRPLIKGFRHILQGETDRSFMLRKSFLNGIRKLQKYNYIYDILINTNQLRFSREFVSLFPNQPFVIDHIAKPLIKEREFTEWRNEIEAIAKYENVHCKISGMITEADWNSWKEEDFSPYIDVVLESFGTKRIMYGSDWPVCLVAGKYEQVFSVAYSYMKKLSIDEQNDFWGLNAKRIYNISSEKSPKSYLL